MREHEEETYEVIKRCHNNDRIPTKLINPKSRDLILIYCDRSSRDWKDKVIVNNIATVPAPAIANPTQ